MKKKTLLIAVAAIVLAVVSACSVTLAWLTANTEEVKNTFTVGKIEIDLWENALSSDGKQLDTNVDPVDGIDTYKIIPGGEQPKNPTVTVKAKSEDCYVYVKVTNNMVLTINGVVTEVVTYELDSKWEQIAVTTDNEGVKSYLYRYEDVIEYSNDDQNTTAVFSKIKYDGTKITSANIGELTAEQVADRPGIVIDAFAHQSANVDSVDVADTAAKTQLGFN